MILQVWVWSIFETKHTHTHTNPSRLAGWSLEMANKDGSCCRNPRDWHSYIKSMKFRWNVEKYTINTRIRHGCWWVFYQAKWCWFLFIIIITNYNGFFQMVGKQKYFPWILGPGFCWFSQGQMIRRWVDAYLRLLEKNTKTEPQGTRCAVCSLRFFLRRSGCYLKWNELGFKMGPSYKWNEITPINP